MPSDDIERAERELLMHPTLISTFESRGKRLRSPEASRGRSVRSAIVAAAAALLFIACAGQSPDSLVEAARQDLAKNNFSAAIIHLKNALKTVPDNGEARLLLGRALMLKRDYVSAEEELWRALRLKQPPEAVLPTLARVLFELGEFDKLVKTFAHHRRLDDAEAQAALSALVGQAYLRLGNGEGAEKAFAAALQARPGFGPAGIGQAMLSALRGNRAEAMTITDSVIAASPRLAEAHAFRAHLLSIDNRLADARDSLKRAIEVEPGHLPARRALIELLIRSRSFEEAGAQIAAGRAIAGGDLSLAYLDGLLDFEKGELAKARENVSQVLRHLPDYVPALILAGAIELRSSKFVLGEANLRKALVQAPGHVGARRLLVGAYLQHGEPARALEALQPLLATEAMANPHVLMLAGETYMANGDVKEAWTHFSRAAQSDAVRAAAQARLRRLAQMGSDAEASDKQLASPVERNAESVRADLAEIAARLQNNQLEDALAAANAFAKRHPDNPLSHLMLGQVNLARQKAAVARRNFVDALRLQPEYLPAIAALASLDLAENKLDDARRRFEEVIARQPKHAHAYVGLAEIQARAGVSAEEISATLRRAIAVDPQAVRPRLALTELYLRNQHSEAALQSAQDAAAALPDDPGILGALAAAREASGDVDGAIEALSRLMAKQPRSPRPLQQLAALHARKKDFDRAAESLRQAQRVAPGDRSVALGLAQAYLQAGKVDEAMTEARAMQQHEPTYAGGHALEGDIHVLRGDWREAERALREALKLEPRAVRVAVQLHRALIGAGKQKDADAHARKWLAENERDPVMRLYLGDLALKSAQHKRAFSLYQEVVGLEPTNVVALNNLAVVAGDLGDARAVGYAERAVKLAPSNPYTLDTLGMLLVNKGESERGFEYLDRARAMAPNVPALRFNYAKALARSGRTQEARRELEALQRRPDSFPGRQEIDRLMRTL